MQYRDPRRKAVDAADPLAQPLHVADARSPHDGRGLRLRWDDHTTRLEFAVPPGQGDVLEYTALSFRAGQVADSPHNPAGQPQDLRVTLRDGGGRERAVRVSAFRPVPFPDVRATDALTKSALTTIRIPLTAYTIACAGLPPVDLHDVVSVAFAFAEQPAGEIDLDSVEFTA
jgi:hypothetical protein